MLYPPPPPPTFFHLFVVSFVLPSHIYFYNINWSVCVAQYVHISYIEGNWQCAYVQLYNFLIIHVYKTGIYNLLIRIHVNRTGSGDVFFGMVPQVQKKPYDQKVDIFSLGMILLELMMPFSTGMERITTLQSARKGVFPKRFCKELPAEVCAQWTSVDHDTQTCISGALSWSQMNESLRELGDSQQRNHAVLAKLHMGLELVMRVSWICHHLHFFGGNKPGFPWETFPSWDNFVHRIVSNLVFYTQSTVQ